MEPMFSQIELKLFSIQFYLMHTKTKMNILFKNEMNIANNLEGKISQAGVGESDNFSRSQSREFVFAWSRSRNGSLMILLESESDE